MSSPTVLQIPFTLISGGVTYKCPRLSIADIQQIGEQIVEKRQKSAIGLAEMANKLKPDGRQLDAPEIYAQLQRIADYTPSIAEHYEMALRVDGATRYLSASLVKGKYSKEEIFKCLDDVDQDALVTIATVLVSCKWVEANKKAFDKSKKARSNDPLASGAANSRKLASEARGFGDAPPASSENLVRDAHGFGDHLTEPQANQ